MTIDTRPRTLREAANVVQSRLDWLRDHQDDLPADCSVRIDTHGNGYFQVQWHDFTGDTLRAIRKRYGFEDRITDEWWHEWSAEGERPEMVIFDHTAGGAA